MKLTHNHKMILAIAANQEKLQFDDCRKVFVTPHHIEAVLDSLCRLNFLVRLENRCFRITPLGMEYLGIEENRKLEDWK